MNLGVEGIKLPETECQSVHQYETLVFWDNFVYPRYCLRGACAPKEERKNKTKQKLGGEETEEIVKVDTRNPTPLTEQLEPQRAADGRPVTESGNPAAGLSEVLTAEAAHPRGT